MTNQPFNRKKMHFRKKELQISIGNGPLDPNIMVVKPRMSFFQNTNCFVDNI